MYFCAAMRLLTLLFFILFLAELLSQSANPFDVRTNAVVHSSLDTITTNSRESDAIERSETQSLNQFDVRHTNTIPTVEKEVMTAPVKKSSPATKSLPGKTPDNSDRGSLNRPALGVFIFLSIVMATFGVSVNRSRFNQLFDSLYNSNTLKSIYRSNPAWFSPQNLLLYTAFIISFSIFIYLLLRPSGTQSSALQWWQIPLAVTFIYILRHITMAVLSYVFPLNNEGNVHNYSIGVHNMMGGLFLIPICLGMIFGPEVMIDFFMIAGFIFLGVIYLLRQTKGLLMALSIKGFNPIYFFIYLCAVEIAPFLIVFRMIRNLA